MKKKVCAWLLAAALTCTAGAAVQAEDAVEITISTAVNLLVSMVRELADSAPAGTEVTELEETVSENGEAVLPDGEYDVVFDTDSSMFHVNEACDGISLLTVENGEMTVHITLASKNIVNLYPGLAEDAKEDEAGWLMPTEDEVTYSDGWTETVYGFDVPVQVLGEEFDLALIGKKGTWYDHKVSVVLAD
ncbi:MAG: hypothetical protein KBT01_08540 [Clostridiales bacterium]|nr:hypothetical protein [Candidatus Blautia equi]